MEFDQILPKELAYDIESIKTTSYKESVIVLLKQLRASLESVENMRQLSEARDSAVDLMDKISIATESEWLDENEKERAQDICKLAILSMLRKKQEEFFSSVKDNNDSETAGRNGHEIMESIRALLGDKTQFKGKFQEMDLFIVNLDGYITVFLYKNEGESHLRTTINVPINQDNDEDLHGDILRLTGEFDPDQTLPKTSKRRSLSKNEMNRILSSLRTNFSG